jgi:hypothetical protein
MIAGQVAGAGIKRLNRAYWRAFGPRARPSARAGVVFFVRDPMKFPDFIHSQERRPGTGMRSNNMQ